MGQALYRHLSEFFSTEEKAFLFFTWPQIFLTFGGVLFGGNVLGGLFPGSPSMSIIFGGVGALLGLALGSIRKEGVPLYQIIWALILYWGRRLIRGPRVLSPTALWRPAGQQVSSGFWLQGPDGQPLLRVGLDDDRGQRRR